MAEGDGDSPRMEIQTLRQTLKNIALSNEQIECEINIIKEEIIALRTEWNGLATSFFSFFYRTKIRCLEREINELKSQARKLLSTKTSHLYIQDIERKIKKFSGSTPNSTIEVTCRGFPRTLDSHVVAEYLKFFKSLMSDITNSVPYINIILIGETGSGKSSLVNTFATALENRNTIMSICSSSPAVSSIGSVTTQIHVEPLYSGDTLLHVRLFDMPGISLSTCVRKQELEMVIDGKIKPGAKIKKATKMMQKNEILRENPTPADQMHCIIFVVRATSDMCVHPPTITLEVMRSIRKLRKDEDVVQFAIVTAIDEIGVNNDDMENAYNYHGIRKISDNVANALILNPNQVIPVSNYFEETTPTAAKNAMSLYALWRVCKAGEDYIKRKWGEDYIRPDFKR